MVKIVILYLALAFEDDQCSLQHQQSAFLQSVRKPHRSSESIGLAPANRPSVATADENATQDTCAVLSRADGGFLHRGCGVWLRCVRVKQFTCYEDYLTPSKPLHHFARRQRSNCVVKIDLSSIGCDGGLMCVSSLKVSLVGLSLFVFADER